MLFVFGCFAIDNPTSCEIHTVILSLHPKNLRAVEIHHGFCTVVYGQNMMGEGTVRQWCRIFTDGQTDVHDEEQSGQ
jgi:hypothetical protein